MKTILQTIAEWLGEDRDCKFTASYTDKCMVLTRVSKTKKEYRDKNPYSKLSKLERLYKKYPELSKVCEFCGEDRIVEIAHKPEHKRNGAWMIVGQTTPNKIWILCPTCHNLLDKKGYTPQQLCLKKN